MGLLKTVLLLFCLHSITYQKDLIYSMVRNYKTGLDANPLIDYMMYSIELDAIQMFINRYY